MQQDKELKVRLQFLEEAREHLDDIESLVLRLATIQTNPKQMDTVLRATHSIKGGAGMMEFPILNRLAHRLEDYFKALKTRHRSVEIDVELENLFLSAIDHLRQVVSLYHQGSVVDELWLETHIDPVFEQLYQRLGEPPDEDTLESLVQEEEQDIVALLFETEVEECLQRLEAILALPQKPRLSEELSTLAQELCDLGTMLQLDSFESFCESVCSHLQSEPERVEEIARLALQEWWRSRALVLTGQIDALPKYLELTGSIRPSTLPPHLDRIEPDQFLITTEDNSDPVIILEQTKFLNTDTQSLDLAINLESKPLLHAEKKQEGMAESTIRIPIKQLDQLSNLFGELIINRSGLDLYLGRSRNLTKALKNRLRMLEKSSARLRSTYDKAAAQTNISQAEALLQKLASLSKTSLEWSSGDRFKGNTGRFDSLEMDRYGDLHLLSQEIVEAIVQLQEIASDIELSLEEANKTSRDLNQTTKQLYTSLTQARMRPLSDLVGQFPRILRDISLQYGKDVKLNISGSKTLIDRTILEVLRDPLIHLLRNALDHGIETPKIRQAQGKPEQGVIEIKAAYQGTQILINVSDDGSGIDLNKIRARAKKLGLDAALLAAASEKELLELIFEPGFSTADKVTDLSGRGVGMDVVRTNLKQVRGDIRVDTELGQGTIFTISVPFILSVVRVLLVESNGILLAFPSDTIEEVVLRQLGQISTTLDQEVLNWSGKIVPLIHLSRCLRSQRPYKPLETEAIPMINAPAILIVSQGKQLLGIEVDCCLEEQEVSVRPVEGPMVMPLGLSGCTILGDGRVVPLVDAPGLLHWVASREQVPSSENLAHNLLAPARMELSDKSLPSTPQFHKGVALVVDDSINVRRFLALTLEKAGYQVEQAKDGQDALEKLLEGSRAQIVICDIEMPRLNGYGLLTRLKEHPDFKQLPVVMLTSRSGDKHRRFAMTLGAEAYFSKPYNEQELLLTIKKLLQPQLLSLTP